MTEYIVKQATCPKCKTPFKGFYMKDGAVQSELGQVVGSLWCGQCIRMMHFGKPSDKKRRIRPK